MKITNKAYINYFDSISCAGKDSSELFESICNKKDTIYADQTLKAFKKIRKTYLYKTNFYNKNRTKYKKKTLFSNSKL